MPRAIRGALIECDPSIRALIISIDMRTHNIILEELDDRHLFIDESKVEYVKKELETRLAETHYDDQDEV